MKYLSQAKCLTSGTGMVEKLGMGNWLKKKEPLRRS